MIRVGKKFGVLIDADNFILQRIKIRGEKSKYTGDEYYETLGYYSSLENALEAAMMFSEKDAISEGEMDIKEALEIIREVHREFTSLISEVLMKES